MPQEPLLQINTDTTAILLERPNRYLAFVELPDGSEVKAHVHDPGRLQELLYPGNELVLRYAAAEHRKTDWDVIAARFENKWILIHSGFHRRIAENLFSREDICPFGAIDSLRAEVTYGHSRLDFRLVQNGKPLWVEIKGCTLAENGRAKFPDAPTKRGTRHLESLIELMQQGEKSALVILIFRSDALDFVPNQKTDPDFSRVFYQAIAAGVSVYPVVLDFDGTRINFSKIIPVVPAP
ncbi:DNA/RNA nuclease SfsA [bacterium]|nr:DNA/RNA nuclease SfsA [bacterium]